MTITPQTVKLASPITHAGQTYTEVTFSREMQMRDMFAMDDQPKGAGTRRTCAMYASMAGVPFDVIAQFTNSDMALAAQAVAALSGKRSPGGQGPAGEKASDGTSLSGAPPQS